MLKTNDREISQELVQNVFITLFNNKSSAHQISAPLAYLYTILKHRILDHYRHDLVHKKYLRYESFQSEKITENDVHLYMESKELEQLLREEIKKLPPQCGNVFRLRREQELSNKEIANRLNISENTVEQHMRKALRVLRHALHISPTVLIFLSSLLS